MRIYVALPQRTYRMWKFHIGLTLKGVCNMARNGNALVKFGVGGFGVFFGLVVLFIIGSFIATPIISNTTKDTAVVTVEDKERIVKDDDSYYLVWTQVQGENGTETPEVFKVTDDFFQGKFNASDTYGLLKEGGVYEVTVNGFRAGLISEYRNILSIDAVVDKG